MRRPVDQFSECWIGRSVWGSSKTNGRSLTNYDEMRLVDSTANGYCAYVLLLVGRRKTPFALFCCLATLCIALASCSSKDGTLSEWYVAGPIAGSRDAAILRSYDAYWDAFLKASDPPDPDAAVLRDHASGVELHRAANVLRARQRSGEHLRGTYEHTTRITGANDTIATVADCLIPRVSIFKEGQEKGPGDSAAMSSVLPIPITALLINRGQTWTVERIDSGKDPCPKSMASKPIAPATRSFAEFDSVAAQ